MSRKTAALFVPVAICLGALALPDLHAQTLEVSPGRVLIDEPAAIRASGLQPGERAIIRAELADGAGANWASQAEFLADAAGTVDTSKQAALAGSYKDISSTGLIWSMKPSSGKTSRYVPPRDFGVQTIDFQLMRGGTQVAAAHLEQAAAAEGVERVALHEGALRGILFLPPGKDRHAGVLVLGGSEGGMPTRRAVWLASHGFAALALAYFGYEDLPKELAGIPLEYFGQALNWMAHRPEIDADRIGVMGTSRGAELALQLGAIYPRIKAVAAYAPASVRYPACCGITRVPYAWTWTGRPLVFRPVHRVPDRQQLALQAAIDVEHTQGPILLISGEDDQVWDSTSMSNAIVARLKEFRFAYKVEQLKYPRAGHAAGRPELVPAWQGWVTNPTSRKDTEMGGTPRGNAMSSLDAIPKAIDFLRQSLAAR